MSTDLLDWRYRVSLVIQDDLDGTTTSETMGCDNLDQVAEFAESIVYVLERRESGDDE